MVFSSSVFLFVFLPLVLAGYWLMARKFRNMFLLAASLFFYAWGEPSFVIVMVGVTMANYVLGLLINIANQKNVLWYRRILLLLTVAANLLPLFYYKYYDFAITIVNNLPGINLPLRGIVLPIGISFFTFQAMSYTFDLYLGKVKVQKNPLHLLLYVSLFPQLIAGPIVRYSDVQDQIQERTVTLDKFAMGLRRFIIGLAKKAIIANSVALTVDNIFSLPATENSMATAWVGILCYTIQIYFDFSGYSDMAIGLGKLFGFDFLENFDYPYISRSMTEFWRRWHISMSTWFRDYIYIPLGGNRRGNVYFNLLVVFFVTGLWHGASWNFIVWGLWHGMFLIIERVAKKRGVNLKLPGAVKWAYTMLIVIIGWVLFRAPDLQYAMDYLGIMFGIVRPQLVGFTVFWHLTRKVGTFMAIAAVAAVPWKQFLPKKEISGTGALVLDRAVMTALMLVCIFFVMTSTYNPFIYFRF